MTTIECPACCEDIEVPDDVAEGEIIVCDECDEELTVTSVDPLALEIADEEDEDEDDLEMDDEDDFDLDEEEEEEEFV